MTDTATPYVSAVMTIQKWNENLRKHTTRGVIRLYINQDRGTAFLFEQFGFTYGRGLAWRLNSPDHLKEILEERIRYHKIRSWGAPVEQKPFFTVPANNSGLMSEIAFDDEMKQLAKDMKTSNLPTAIYSIKNTRGTMKGSAEGYLQEALDTASFDDKGGFIESKRVERSAPIPPVVERPQTWGTWA